MRHLLFALALLVTSQITAQMPKELSAMRVPKLMAPPTNIYEVNIRQFTKEGTINAFATHLPRLRKMGVELLWFMPVQPIGVEKRKGPMGSYYSIQDYMAINPEFGTMEDFINMVQQAHELGFKVILDWVANHTAWDHAWIKQHPEWYTLDSTGRIASPFDWTDVADLNYDNKDLRRAMIEAMKFWLRATDIDGFRCDVAELVPLDFWENCRKELMTVKNVFMLAEGEKPELHPSFDMTYSWTLHHLMNEIAQGKKTVKDIEKYLEEDAKKFPANTIRMNFTTNHDENSWNGTEFERMGQLAKACAVVTYVVPGMPLLYSGQEEPLKKRLKFFEKDPIEWKNYEFQPFYTELNALKNSNYALKNVRNDAQYAIIRSKNNTSIFAIRRDGANKRVLAFVNLSNKTQKVTFDDNSIAGKYTVQGSNPKVSITVDQKHTVNLPAGEWIIYVEE